MEKIEKWISNNKDIEQELIRLRRHFHEHPEVGHPLPQTQEYIVKLLEMYGYENIIVNPGGSIEILVGPHDKKILLLAALFIVKALAKTPEPVQGMSIILLMT